MKLNPFTKKSTAYYDKAKADFNKLNQELTTLTKRLTTAQADYDQEKSRYDQLCESAGRYSLNSTEPQRRQHKVVSEASNRVDDLKRGIAQLESRIAPSRRLVQAPEQFAQARQELEDLIRQQSALALDLDKTDTLIAKVSKRIAGLDERLAAETSTAAQTMLNEEGEFVVPESLAKIEVELRLGNTSLAQLQLKRTELASQLGELPRAISKAQDTFIYYRAVVAEIELHEQLMPVMDLFARASVARRQNSYHHDEYRFEIEIPHDLIEPAQAALAAELPTA